ncbi:ARM repeat-containing protein [Suhomyces tanzawaensis NRRL Y-17324]|uniref:non-specific serine/threonine protein kinase n=1 Tax=Suhomyces tanzawaensis NRRL Y-17324 TaxID=984487 RepID=A0A1E4SQQ5_9ASCO|nr:ARM repeat-containing protein [Suhomyces tanzawaensis NRRL Y-17324]ODV81831.1 ARM repeat-containing protein [Suhomyces tanzawaensis NRRL Y-17324]
MGARLSLLAPSAPTVAISSYVDILQSFQYIDLLNNPRFLKTIRAIDNSNGNLVIIKILIKPSSTPGGLQLDQVIELLTKQASLLAQFNHVLPWHKLIETDRAGYLIRQMLKTNLYDRLSIRPFLEPIEKKFMVYQMLKIIEDCHRLGIHHGDLKLENFVVTSWNWLMLSDFASYTKPVYLPEDNPSQFSFYFDSSDRRVCYLAPERFYNSSKESRGQTINDDGQYAGKDGLTDQMDLFSLGCVIAELYLDGEPTFTLSQLFKFVKSEYKPDLSTIHDSEIRSLIEVLIQRNPNKRPSAEDLLHSLHQKCFPPFFYDFLYQFMSDLNDNSLYEIPLGNSSISINDLKIDKIYRSFDKIAEALGFEYEREEQDNDSAFVPIKLNLPGMPNNYHIKPFNFSEKLGQASLIILGVIFSLMRSTKQVSSKIKACELIVAFSERINDECKLDRSIPYLSSLLNEFIEDSYQASNNQNTSTLSSRVVCTALTSITTLLLSCTYITPINVLMFPEYLLPKLSSLMALNYPLKEKDTIKVTLASCLPYLASVSKKFWMMSKTFKSENHLGASTNEGNQQFLINQDSANLPSSGFTIPKSQLDADFENLTFTLLTDSNPVVKISLLNNVLPLCQFFGVDKTNDIILPHLITYLNDPNFHLRLVFLSSVLKIGQYVGVLSFEQYLLPLLIQTLRDLEQFVVLKVLEIFNEFVLNRLINPKTEFNALEIYKELLVNSINLLLHPNEWIRQAVMNLIISISDNLSAADRYCFLYPLIKGFLSYDLSTFTWDSLYPCITKPLSRQVYDLATTWSLNATPKSLFWQQKNFSTLSQLNSAKKSVVSFTKNMGNSVYLPRLNSEVVFPLSNGNKSSVPLSPEDKQWLIKLKSVGLEDRDLWKVFVLRDYIYHVCRNGHGKSNSTDLSGFSSLSNTQLVPRNVFFDVSYKSESLSAGSRTTESNVELLMNPDDSISLRDFDSGKGMSNLLILPNFARVKASIQTVEANVFGELEMSHDSNGNSSHIGHHNGTHDSNSHKVFSVNSSKIITVNLKHSYTGYNPFILNYLNNLEFEPSLNNFSEFGNLVGSEVKSKLSKESAEHWTPKGILVTQVKSTQAGGEIDGVNCVEVCPTSEFFISGSDSGLLKVWNTAKLEKIITVLNPSLTVDLKSSITSIRFLPNRFVFSVTTVDGITRLYRVDVIRNKAKKITKFSKLTIIRKFELDVDTDGYILKSDFLVNDKQSLMVGITSCSKIVGYDIIRLEKSFEVQNPLIHGLTTTFMFQEKNMWLLVGTSKGVLSLWDIRFHLLVKSWKVQLKQPDDTFRNTPFAIRKLIALPKSYQLGTQSEASYFAMIGGSGESDITVWEVPAFECKQVFSSQVETPYVKNYSLIEISNDTQDYTIDSILESLEIEFATNDPFENENTPDNKSFTAFKYMASQSHGYFLSSTWNQRLILWNLTSIADSVSVNCEYETKFISNTFKRQTLTLVNEMFEKKKEPVKSGYKKEAYGLEEVSSNQIDAVRTNQDMVTDLGILTRPFEMAVSVDRNGCINVYK